MTSTIRTDLAVPYAEKEDAKALGARWDSERKLWYAPPGTDLGHLTRWLPRGFTVPNASAPAPASDAEPDKGVSLTDLLTQVRGVIDRGMPEAVWVRAEISELRGKNGHLYLTLAERNEHGDVLAQCKGVIWRSRAEVITPRFEQATGEGQTVEGSGS